MQSIFSIASLEIYSALLLHVVNARQKFNAWSFSGLHLDIFTNPCGLGLGCPRTGTFWHPIWNRPSLKLVGSSMCTCQHISPSVPIEQLFVHVHTRILFHWLLRPHFLHFIVVNLYTKPWSLTFLLNNCMFETVAFGRQARFVTTCRYFVILLIHLQRLFTYRYMLYP